MRIGYEEAECLSRSIIGSDASPSPTRCGRSSNDRGGRERPCAKSPAKRSVAGAAAALLLLSCRDADLRDRVRRRSDGTAGHTGRGRARPASASTQRAASSPRRAPPAAIRRPDDQSYERGLRSRSDARPHAAPAGQRRTPQRPLNGRTPHPTGDQPRADTPDRDPTIETDLILALTGFAPLLELGVIKPHAALAAIDQHLDRLFRPVS